MRRSYTGWERTGRCDNGEWKARRQLDKWSWLGVSIKFPRPSKLSADGGIRRPLKTTKCIYRVRTEDTIAALTVRAASLKSNSGTTFRFTYQWIWDLYRIAEALVTEDRSDVFQDDYVVFQLCLYLWLPLPSSLFLALLYRWVLSFLFKRKWLLPSIRFGCFGAFLAVSLLSSRWCQSMKIHTDSRIFMLVCEQNHHQISLLPSLPSPPSLNESIMGRHSLRRHPSLS